MAKEIERKFLVRSLQCLQQASSSTRISQGYLNSDPLRTVRVRIKGDKAYICVKGLSDIRGLSRYEWEREIEIQDAEELLLLCETGVIEKTRYNIEYKGHLFELDVFHQDNEGLIMAEIELKEEGESFERPEWIGEEVTGDIRYYNSYLSLHPYKSWDK